MKKPLQHQPFAAFVVRPDGIEGPIRHENGCAKYCTKPHNWKVTAVIRYVADFAYWAAKGCPEFIVEDAKSPHLRNNPVFRIKMHLLKLEHGIEVILV